MFLHSSRDVFYDQKLNVAKFYQSFKNTYLMVRPNERYQVRDASQISSIDNSSHTNRTLYIENSEKTGKTDFYTIDKDMISNFSVSVKFKTDYTVANNNINQTFINFKSFSKLVKYKNENFF